MSKKGPTGDFFFFIFAKKKKKKRTIFSYQKKKKKKLRKKNAAARLAIITATRWTGNRLFVVDSLKARTPVQTLQYGCLSLTVYCYGVNLNARGNDLFFFIHSLYLGPNFLYDLK